MQRSRVVVGVVLAVLVGYCGIAIALIQSASLASVVASAVILSGLGLTVGLLLEIHPALSRDQAVEVIQGQGDLMRRYEDLRRTEGAVRIQAIWSAVYPSSELASYLAAERTDLQRLPGLKVERLVSSERLSESVRADLLDQSRDIPNLDYWEIESVVIECNICEYIRERSSYLKALIVLGGIDHTAQVAFYIDSREQPTLSGVLHELRSWFEGLQRRSI